MKSLKNKKTIKLNNIIQVNEFYKEEINLNLFYIPFFFNLIEQEILNNFIQKIIINEFTFISNEEKERIFKQQIEDKEICQLDIKKADEQQYEESQKERQLSKEEKEEEDKEKEEEETRQKEDEERQKREEEKENKLAKIEGIIETLFENFKVVEVKQITKVAIGYKRNLQRIIIVTGNNLDTVGFGIGRDTQAQIALEKAKNNAFKNLITLPVNFNSTLPTLIYSSYSTAKVIIKPISYGFGIKANKTIKPLFCFGGLKNISCKQLGSRNVLNNIKAVMKAFLKLIK